MGASRGAGVELRTRCLIFHLHPEGSAVLALRLVVVGYGQEFLALLAEWSYVQYESPRLRSEAGGFSGGDWKVNGSGKKALGHLPCPEEDNRKLHCRSSGLRQHCRSSSTTSPASFVVGGLSARLMLGEGL